jgi:23S rRNA pseudouridine1911/1915/1917 synthase
MITFASILVVAVSAFLPPTATRKVTTICVAKLNKIASNFNLDEILLTEKELTHNGDSSSSEQPTDRRSRSRRKDNKRKKIQQQIERRKKEKDSKGNEYPSPLSNAYATSTQENNCNENDSNINFDSIDFMTYIIPTSLDGKRIDAVLVDLLNDYASESNTEANVKISRSQCGVLLSNQCVLVISPDDASDFLAKSNLEEASISHELIQQYCSPIERKSYNLEASSILVYPSRQSILSPSSMATALLSNSIPPTEIIPQNIPLDILFEDEYMIVINKRAGMVVHPAAGNWDSTVVNALAYYLMNESPYGAGEYFTISHTENRQSGDIEDEEDREEFHDGDNNMNESVTNSISMLRPGIVHRLDKGTTGVLVVAKTRTALANLSEMFANRRVKKQYLAIAIGNTGEDQWIDKPIGRHPLHRQKMRVLPDPSPSKQKRVSVPPAKRGRYARSHIHTLHFDGKFSIVQVQIATGRTHQIRVHLQDHGTPIYGDDIYGFSDWNKALSSRRGITRPLLHAARLEIDHPVTGERMVFEAEPADDMKGVMNAILPAADDMMKKI